MPDGKLGKMESGRWIFLLKCSQKQRGQSFNNDKLDGLNLYGMINLTLKKP